MDKIPTQEEYEDALKDDTDLDKMIIKLGELNELVYEDLILYINTTYWVGKGDFKLVWIGNSVEFPEGECKIVWDRLVNDYASHTTLSLLKLKSRSHISKLESIRKDPDEQISKWKCF